MALYVVVANKTLAAERLTAHLRAVAERDPDAEVRAVVPVAPPNTAAFEVGGALGGIAVVDVELRSLAVSAAQERLDALLAWLSSLGVPSSGSVVVEDPVAAVERIVASHEVAEVIVSTLPATVSRWLRIDLPQRLRRRIANQVTVLEDSGDTLPAVVEIDAHHEEPHASRDAAATVHISRKVDMTDSVYKIIELVGTSTESWEKAAEAAVRTARKSLRDLRIAEVMQLDLVVGDSDDTLYRAKIKVSFKYENGE